MENISETNEFVVKGQSINDLYETRKWTLFLSIFGMIFLGLLVLFTLFITTHNSEINGQPINIFFSKISLIIMTILFTIIYFFPIYFLLQFSKYSKRAINYKNEHDIQMTFKYLKYHFKYIGILLIIFLAFYTFIGLIVLVTKLVI